MDYEPTALEFVPPNSISTHDFDREKINNKINWYR